MYLWHHETSESTLHHISYMGHREAGMILLYKRVRLAENSVFLSHPFHWLSCVCRYIKILSPLHCTKVHFDEILTKHSFNSHHVTLINNINNFFVVV